MKLVYIRDSKSKGYTVLGINSDGATAAYTVESSLYANIGAPLPSDEISEEHFSDIVYSDGLFRATKKALSLLSYSDNSGATLAAKVRRAGFSAEIAEACVEDMMRHGYINEQRQLERLIAAEVNFKLCGRAKLIPKLMAKGYKRCDIEAVTDRLIESGEIDFDRVRAELIQKKLGDSPEDGDVRALLYKSGFYAD